MVDIGVNDAVENKGGATMLTTEMEKRRPEVQRALLVH